MRIWGTSGQFKRTLSSICAGYIPPITRGSNLIKSSEMPNWLSIPCISDCSKEMSKTPDR